MSTPKPTPNPIEHDLYNLKAGVSWPSSIHPKKWRDMVDPDEIEDADNDEDLPASDYVKSVLGFDPDELE